MIKRVSEEFIDDFLMWSFVPHQDHYDIRLNKKPTKRLKKEIDLVFSAFGGAERTRFVYEFTYNPYGNISNAINYGYLPLAHMNYAFVPTQILRTMNSYLSLPEESCVYYPFYGYGDFYHSKHDEYRKFAIPETIIPSFRPNDIEPHDEMYQYDAIFMRPPLSGNLAWAAIRDNTKYLKNGGKLITIIDSKSVNTPIFNEHMTKNFNNVRCYIIPELTWTPTQYPNRIYAYVVYGESV